MSDPDERRRRMLPFLVLYYAGAIAFVIGTLRAIAGRVDGAVLLPLGAASIATAVVRAPRPPT